LDLLRAEGGGFSGYVVKDSGPVAFAADAEWAGIGAAFEFDPKFQFNTLVPYPPRRMSYRKLQ